MAGEIGHVIADAAGPRCTCGATGCLEALISGPAIAREAREAVARGEPSRLPRGTALTAVDVYRAAADGDELCAAIVREVGRRIAWAIHLVVMTYDVKRVVLGGGVSQAGETFLRPIERELDRLRQSSELARDQLAPEMVVLLPAGADAGAWGAVTIANLAGVEANRHRA
jgi:predicted NBD/HSP70 family sugar kinase